MHVKCQGIENKTLIQFVEIGFDQKIAKATISMKRNKESAV
jgi:hypothetical protein